MLSKNGNSLLGGEAKMAPSGERLEPIIASLCARVFRPCITSAVLDWGDLKPSIKFESPKDQGVVCKEKVR